MFYCCFVQHISESCVCGKAQIPLCRLSLKLPRGDSRRHKLWKSRTQMVTNHEIMNFWWKSPTQIMKVVHTNHHDMSRCLSSWQVPNILICVALMELSPLQCMGKVRDKVHSGHKSWKLVSWFVSRTFVICVRVCCGLRRKVGVMEFGLNVHCIQNMHFYHR